MGGVWRKGKKGVENPPAEIKKPRFFTVIVFPADQLRKLRIPNRFAKEHGKHLRDFVDLQAPNGKKWRVEIIRSNGEIWLHKGWDLFAQHYSLAFHYVLVFTYDIQRSKFRVIILDASTSVEIDYTHNHTDDDDGDTCTESGGEMLALDDAKERVEQRAKAFHSENPFFPVHIRKRNLTFNSGPFFPTSHCTTYYKNNDGSNKIVLRINKKTWDIKYRIEKVKSFIISLASGWKDFVMKNQLEEGDICVFELIHSGKKTYNVHIFRISDETPIQPFVRTEKYKRRIPEAVKARVKENLVAFMGDGPGFTIHMKKSHVNLNCAVHIDVGHARTFLKDGGNDRNAIVVHGKDGFTWELKYGTQDSNPRLAFGGWNKFRSDNHLEIGDICAFKMIHGKQKEYQVAIFRVNGS